MHMVDRGGNKKQEAVWPMSPYCARDVNHHFITCFVRLTIQMPMTERSTKLSQLRGSNSHRLTDESIELINLSVIFLNVWVILACKMSNRWKIPITIFQSSLWHLQIAYSKQRHKPPQNNNFTMICENLWLFQDIFGILLLLQRRKGKFNSSW